MLHTRKILTTDSPNKPARRFVSRIQEHEKGRLRETAGNESAPVQLVISDAEI